MTQGGSVNKLTRDCFATGIHGATGQRTEEGTLEAGALVRDVRGYPGHWRFEASTDNGKTWYTQESDARPVIGGV